MHDIGHRFDVLDRIGSFDLNRHFPGFAQNQVGFDVVNFGKDFEHAHAVNRPSRAGHCDDESFLLIHWTNSNVS